MKLLSISLGALLVVLTVRCTTGTRNLDFINKRFEITYNVDSTRGIDSAQVARLKESKAIYTFSEDGKGINHTQMGMLSKDTPFTWKLEKDSLFIDGNAYTVQKQGQGFTLKSDSVKMILSQQQ